MKRELMAFADFVAGELLDLYQMKGWGCNFEDFKRNAQNAISETFARYTIDEEDE